MWELSCLHSYSKTLFIMNLELNEKCFSPVVWIKIELDGKIQTRCCFTGNINIEFISVFRVSVRTIMGNRIAAEVVLTFMGKIWIKYSSKVMNIYFASTWRRTYGRNRTIVAIYFAFGFTASPRQLLSLRILSMSKILWLLWFFFSFGDFIFPLKFSYLQWNLIILSGKACLTKWFIFAISKYNDWFVDKSLYINKIKYM